MASGGVGLPAAAILFVTASLSLCLNASSRRISSSMRFENRYRRIHLPRLTLQCQRLNLGRFKKRRSHTSLILPELHGLLQSQLIRVHLGIEAVIRFQHDRQVTRADIDRAPRGSGLSSVNLWLDVLKVSLPKTLDGAALVIQ